MAGSNVSDSTNRDAVADYLAAVAAQLPGPAAAQVAVTDELRDGLLEALEIHQARGCSPRAATAAAIGSSSSMTSTRFASMFVSSLGSRLPRVNPG